MLRNPSMVSSLFGSLAALTVLASCAAAGEPDRPTRAASPPAHVGVAPPTRIPDVVPPTSSPPGEPVSIASVPRAARRAVVTDAARRFAVAESAVVLTRAERVDWPDASLGCPEPGRMYAQRIVQGFRLVAKTTQGELEYHADSSGNVTTCAGSPREQVKKRPPVDPVTGSPPAQQR